MYFSHIGLLVTGSVVVCPMLPHVVEAGANDAVRNASLQQQQGPTQWWTFGVDRSAMLMCMDPDVGSSCPHR
jgi:hypothetical protein